MNLSGITPLSWAWRRSRQALAVMFLAVPLALFGAVATARAATNQATVPPATAKAVHLSWGDKLKDAGVVGVVQFALSAFGAIFIFERLFGLRRKHLVPVGLTARAAQLWQEGKFEALEKLGETEPSTWRASFPSSRATASRPWPTCPGSRAT